MTLPTDSPYAVLEVPRQADAATIDAAYQKLSGLLAETSLAAYGMLEGGDATRLRQQLEQAYAILRCPRRRAHFDQTGQVVPPAPPPREAAAAAEAPRPVQGTAQPDLAAQLAEELLLPAALPAARPAATSPAPPAHRPPVPGGPTLAVPLAGALQADSCFDGALLRALRESAQVSIDELSDWTKIGRRYLLAIENDDYALLPAKVYVRGFVAEIARILGLDRARVANSYLEGYLAWSRTLP